MNITPIETHRAGYRFRSRLEARWSIVFDELGLKWQYEPEGFEIFPFMCARRGKSPAALAAEMFQSEQPQACRKGCHHGTKYLPDFYLPDTETWVEVKGDADALPVRMLSEAIGGCQLPNIHELPGNGNGLLLLGPIPDASTWPLHPLIRHGIYGDREDGYVLPCMFHHGTGPRIILLTDEENACVSFGYRNQDYTTRYVEYIQRFWSDSPLTVNGPPPENVRNAYLAARRARFEHGEKN